MQTQIGRYLAAPHDRPAQGEMVALAGPLAHIVFYINRLSQSASHNFAMCVQFV
jgi:hypothetical protein